MPSGPDTCERRKLRKQRASLSLVATIRALCQSRWVRIRDQTKGKPRGVESGCVKEGHMVIRVGLRVGQAGL